MPEASDHSADRVTSLGFTAMEFRRVARMNKHQLWSICVSWCRDRTAAAAVLSRGLTIAWSTVENNLDHLFSDDVPLSPKLTETVYRCVLDAATDSLAADRVRAELAEEDAFSALSAEEISLYILVNYSPLPRDLVCGLLDVPSDGTDILDRVTKALLRESSQSR